MAEKTFQFLHYTVTDRIAEIVLDRPPANLIDREITLEYLAALDLADADPDVSVIVLSGKGKGLSGGADLRVLDAFGPVEMKEFLSLFYVEMVRRVRVLTKPIIPWCTVTRARAPAPWPSPATW